MSELNGHHIQMAEQKLMGRIRITAEAVEVNDALFSISGVQRAAFESYLDHHWETVHKRLPELDPRIEPTINTHLRHFFLVGVMSERERELGT